jgi:dihydroorotate dehydrogenase electron transfer subunit
MLKTDLNIAENTMIAQNTYRMVLTGDMPAMRPGQFVDISVADLFLRRPISVCDFDGGRLTLVYKVVGKGTEKMAALPCGQSLDVLCGRGNGFDTSVSGARPLLLGGGAGCAPLFYLARQLVSEGKKPAAVLGFNEKNEIFFENEFRALGADVYIATLDGSAGAKGFVTDAAAAANLAGTYFYACGPRPMMQAVSESFDAAGQLSFEERMGCGFGACMGCSVMTKSGAKRICKEGPVLLKEEVIW